MKCRAHSVLLTWRGTQGANLSSIPRGAQARLSPATGVSPFSRNCRQRQVSCYCFWPQVGFSWPGSMDGTFTGLGFPWELSPFPPRTMPAEGTHPLPLLSVTHRHSSYHPESHASTRHLDFGHSRCLPWVPLLSNTCVFPFLRSSVILKVAFGEILSSTYLQNRDGVGWCSAFVLSGKLTRNLVHGL